MKKTILFIFFIGLHLISIAQNSETPFTNRISLQDLIAKSKAEKKIILLEVTADWCVPCKKMDAETFSNKDIKKYIKENFIAIKVNIDTSGKNNEDTRFMHSEYSSVIKQYKINAVPTFFFLDSSKNLIHREGGFFNAEALFSIFKTVKEGNDTYRAQLAKLQKGQLADSSILDLALKLKRYGEDSLANISARSYKNRALSSSSFMDILNSKTAHFIFYFIDIFNSNDTSIRWIFRHQQETDNLAATKDLSIAIIDRIVTRDLIVPEVGSEGHFKTENPNWEQLQKRIAKIWDNATAERTILDYKIKWYTFHKKWDSMINCQIKQIDQMDSYVNNALQAAGINNFVWDVTLRHSNDKHVLKKSSEYMEKITTRYPDNIDFLDTFANVLYKLGDKQAAITVEKKALTIAEKKLTQKESQVYRQTLEKMQKNELIWID